MSTERIHKPASLSDYLIHDAPPSMYYIPDFITSDEERFILSKIPPNRWISLSHRRLQAHPARLTGPSNTLVTAAPLPAWLVDPIVPRIHALGVFPQNKTTVSTAASSTSSSAVPTTEINHCLINEYLPAQGILAHEDGPAYYPVVATISLGGSIVLDVQEKKKGKKDTVPTSDNTNDKVTDELQHDAVTEDSPSSPSPSQSEPSTVFHSPCQILQEPRSLLLTTGTAYTETLHGIAERSVDEDLNSATVANWSLLGDPVRKRIVAASGRNIRDQTRISLTFRNVLKVKNVGSKIFGKTRT